MSVRSPYSEDSIQKAVKILGSMHRLAFSTETSYGSVFKWVHGKASPSPFSCLKIERATKGEVKKEDILPSFDWDHFRSV